MNTAGSKALVSAIWSDNSISESQDPCCMRDVGQQHVASGPVESGKCIP